MDKPFMASFCQENWKNQGSVIILLHESCSKRQKTYSVTSSIIIQVEIIVVVILQMHIVNS